MSFLSGCGVGVALLLLLLLLILFVSELPAEKVAWRTFEAMLLTVEAASEDCGTGGLYCCRRIVVVINAG